MKAPKENSTLTKGIYIHLPKNEQEKVEGLALKSAITPLKSFSKIGKNHENDKKKLTYRNESVI